MGEWSAPVRPMLAMAGPVPAGTGWAFEFKWDGIRAIVEVDAGGARLTSRNGRDLGGSFPEVAEAVAAVGGEGPLLLDGELVALDATGAPSFARLQQRMHVRRPAVRLLADVPVRLYVFDVLVLDGRSVLAEPYLRRRHLLDGLALRGPYVETPPAFLDVSGADVLAVAREHGLEGIVAKRLDAPYQPGVRSRAWIKVPLERTAEVVIAGWKPGEGRRSGTIGSLLLGMYDPRGRLTFTGHVGTGFTERALRLLQERLRPLERATSPFDGPVPREHARHAHWVQPALVGEVAYRNVTPDGRLRHPSWRGLRPDRDPGQLYAGTSP